MSLGQRYHCCSWTVQKMKSRSLYWHSLYQSTKRKNVLFFLGLKNHKDYQFHCVFLGIWESENRLTFTHIFPQFILLINILPFEPINPLTSRILPSQDTSKIKDYFVQWNIRMAVIPPTPAAPKMWCFIPLLISIFRGFLFKIKTRQTFIEAILFVNFSIPW